MTWLDENGLTFNPVDKRGRSLPNRFKLVQNDILYGLKMIDLRSLPERAVIDDYLAEKDGNDDNPTKFVESWTMIQAVSFLCWTLNPREEFIKNPTIAEMVKTFNLSQNDPFFEEEEKDYSPKVIDINIPHGASLPVALDKILGEFDFSWFLDPSEGHKQKLRITSMRSKGVESEEREVFGGKSLKLQPYSSQLDRDLSEVAGFNLNMNSESRSANVFHGIGGFPELEVSVELRPCWKEEYDEEYQDELKERLQKSHPEWIKNPDLQIAWRKFAANEGGDYTDIRPWWFFATTFNPLSCDGGSLYGTNETNVRRRKLHPTSTLGENGRSAGPFKGYLIEYWDPDKGDDGSWVVAIGGDTSTSALLAAQDLQILDDEIAILLNGNIIPPQLTGIQSEHGIEHVKFRITGTIKGDRPMYFPEDGAAGDKSFTNGLGGVVIPRWDSYKLKSQQAESYYAVLLAEEDDVTEDSASKVYADTRDDCAAFESYISVLARNNRDASISGTLEIEGADNANFIDYVGNSLNKIQGRELFFSRAHSKVDETNVPGMSAGDKSYPTITKVVFNFSRQMTTMYLETL
jgi:hypothetical protein